MKIRKILIISIILILILATPSFADFGGLESYDSGSDYDSSDYDSGSSRDSGSSWDGSYDLWWFWPETSSNKRVYDSDGYDQDGYDRAGYDRYGNKRPEKSWIAEAVIVGAVMIIVFTSRGLKKPRNYGNSRNNYNTSTSNFQGNTASTNSVNANFDEHEFHLWVSDIFVKLQYAWSNMQEEVIKPLETPELYVQHAKILERYRANREINKVENVTVCGVKVVNYYKVGNKDVVTIFLKAQMIDYMMSTETRMVVRGNSTELKVNTYKMIFTRPTGSSENSEWILAGMSKI